MKDFIKLTCLDDSKTLISKFNIQFVEEDKDGSIVCLKALDKKGRYSRCILAVKESVDEIASQLGV